MKKLLNICLVLLVMTVLCPAATVARAEAGSAGPGDNVQQFTAGSHVLGFSPDGYYAAAGDHSLRVEFVGSAAALPLTESAGSGQGMAAMLGKVFYRGAWRGVDIAYNATGAGIAESVYYLDAPASVNSIRLRYNRPVALDPQGNLLIGFESGSMMESAPVAWQESGGVKQPVEASWVLYGGQEAGFALAGCRPGIPVVIDPVLSWNTVFGAGTTTVCIGIAADTAGNLYVTGESGTTWGIPVQPFHGGPHQAFAAKLNSSGTLVWNTFLGDTGFDYGYDIAVDAAGNAYVAGQTFGKIGWDDAFVTKLDNSGAVIWSTYLGSAAGTDKAVGIVVDAQYNTYVTGNSNVTWGASPRRAYTGGQDAFVAMLDSNGTLAWNTFLGGTADDEGKRLALDVGGNSYIVGTSGAAWQGDSAPRRAFTASDYDTFAARLDGNGFLLWNTFLGGVGSDDAGSITMDGSGNVYVAGYSTDTWGNPLQPFPGASEDGYIVKLNSGGDLIWLTFFGSASEVTMCTGITSDAGGNLYVCGFSAGPWGAPWLPYSGGIFNAYVASMSGSGVPGWNAFLGNDNVSAAFDIVADSNHSACLAGTWNSRFFSYDSGFVAKISWPVPVPAITSFTPARGGSSTPVTITGTDLTGATAVSFGGVPAARFTVDSDTQITAITGGGATGVVAVTTPGGTGASAAVFTFVAPVTYIGTGSHGASMPGSTTAIAQQSPVPMASIIVKSAALSSDRVLPGEQVNVTASVANTGTAGGTGRLVLYVNGQEESSRGVMVSSGGSTPVTFTVARSEPGTYEVYVGRTPAGSFTVDGGTDSSLVLYVSMALIAIALAGGLVFLLGRRRAVN